MIPGIHVLPEDEYHALRDMLSASICKVLIERSPAHAKYQRDHGWDDATKQSDRGSIAHALLFEGVERMAVLEYPDYRTNAAKEARESARAASQYPVLSKDVQAIRDMVGAARHAWETCPDLQGYAPANGKPELSVIWNDDATPCRCRPDWLSNDYRVIIDGKFSEHPANPETVARQIIGQAFDQRAAFYCRGIHAVTRVAPVYVYLFQEVDPPYCTSFVSVSPAMLELGRAKVTYALGRWRECISTDVWPGYDQRIHYAEPPSWALEQWGVTT